MPELMLINPRKRRRRKHKMSAKQRRYFGKRSHKRRKRHTALSLAPRRRRHYMSNPRRRHKRYRHNPIGGFRPMAFVKDTLMPSAIGAGGALGLDLLMGYLPLPDTIKTGTWRPVVRIAGAVAIGMIAGMVTNKRVGEQVGAGALTVVLYDTLKGFITTQFPTLQLGDLPSQYPNMEYISPAPQVSDMSAYVTDSMSEVGEYVY